MKRLMIGHLQVNLIRHGHRNRHLYIDWRLPDVDRRWRLTIARHRWRPLTEAYPDHFTGSSQPRTWRVLGFDCAWYPIGM